MYSVTFKPASPEWARRIVGLTQEQRVLLSTVLDNLVANIFYPLATGYQDSVSFDGTITIIVNGVVPYDVRACDDFTQQIANKLTSLGFREIYYISGVQRGAQPLDRLLAPSQLTEVNMAQSLLAGFNLMGCRIPQRFVCPITGEIMYNPAYLTSNRLVNYESRALMTWIVTNHSDPTTRADIFAPGIIDNHELQQEIFEFVMHTICGRNVEHYFAEEVVPAAAAVASPEVGSNIVALFPAAAAAPVPILHPKLSLVGIFTRCRLTAAFDELSGKALRRAANAGLLDEVMSLVEYCGINIANLQDEGPTKRTALHFSVIKKRMDVVRFLFTSRAKTDIQDADGKTVIDYARESDSDEIKELFGLSRSLAAAAGAGR